MTYDYGHEALRLAEKMGLSFDVYYSDDDPEVDDAAYSGRDSRLAWAEATACDSASVFFSDDTWISLVHGNEPNETISDFSLSTKDMNMCDYVRIGGEGIASLVCNMILKGVRA